MGTNSKQLIILFLCSVLLLTGCSYKIVKTEDEKDAEIKSLQQQLADIQEVTTSTEDTISQSPQIIERTIIREVAPTVSQESNQAPAIQPDPEAETDDVIISVGSDNIKYQEALSEQIDSHITAQQYLISYVEIVYGYTNNDAVRVLEGHKTAIAPFGTLSSSISLLISKHIEMLDSVISNFKAMAKDLYIMRDFERGLLSQYQQLRTNIISDSSIDRDYYTQISNQLNELSTSQLRKRDAAEHILNVVNQSIQSEEDSIRNSLAAIGEALNARPLSLTPYSPPSYPRPSFNITQCSVTGGGSVPVSVNCYGNSF